MDTKPRINIPSSTLASQPNQPLAPGPIPAAFDNTPWTARSPFDSLRETMEVYNDSDEEDMSLVSTPSAVVLLSALIFTSLLHQNMVFPC